MRQTFLPFALPDTDDDEINEIAEAVRSGWITTGPKVRQFENDFARLVGAKHAVAVNSCTAAMHLALEAIGLQEGDEVITSPLTFAATAEVIRYFNAKPVLADVDPESLNLDPVKLENVINSRTRAVMPVHLGGMPADMLRIGKIAREHKLLIVEDAAHAMPDIYHNRPDGAAGDIICYSFYATKTLTTGEGGMILTDNDVWAERCRMMSLHGISHNAWKRYTAEGSWYYEILAPGFKYNMTDVAAAMGIAQLRKVEKMWQRRTQIANHYSEAFSAVKELQLPHAPEEGRHAWHLYLLRLNLDQLRIDRAGFIDELKKLNIGTSVHFIPLHIHPYYVEMYQFKPDDFPIAYQEYLRMISLPIYSKMTDHDVEDVIGAVKDVVANNRVA